MKLFFISLTLIAFFTTSQGFAANESLNVAGKRAGIIGKSAVAGAAGGMVVGVASQAFKRKTKNIFLFGSLGLYAGIAMGLYIISAPRGSTPYEGPDTYEDYGSYESSLKRQRPDLLADSLTVEVPVVSVNF